MNAICIEQPVDPSSSMHKVHAWCQLQAIDGVATTRFSRLGPLIESVSSDECRIAECDQAPPLEAPALKTPKAKANGCGTPYPSLAKALPPAKRLAKFLKATAGEAANAMTDEELESWLSKFPNLWPDDAEIDEFVSWLHKARREGRYT